MTLSDTHLPNTQPPQLWKRAGDIRAHLKRQCVYSSQPQAWHVKHVWSMPWTWGEWVFFLCAPLSPGTRVKNVKHEKKGKVITAPFPGRVTTHPEVLTLMGHQYSPGQRRQGNAKWPLCPARNQTKRQEEGKNKRWETQSFIHQLGVTLTSGNVSELH